MGSNKPRRNHSIPQVLLRNFCGDSGLLWVYDGTKVFQTNPHNVFVERDLYSRTHLLSLPNDHTRDYGYENSLSEVETRAAPAIRQIVASARCGECPRLSLELSDAFKHFFFAQARRTPESQQRVSAAQSVEDTIYDVLRAAAERDGYPLPDKDSLYRDSSILQWVQAMASNIDAKFAAGDDSRLQTEAAKFAYETGIRVALIPTPSREFVIGSHGIAIVHLEYAHPAGGSWLPLAPDVAVQVTMRPDREELVSLDGDDEGDAAVAMINEATASLSKVIAGRSEKVIRSLIRE